MVGGQTSGRSDIYTLGIVIYEMIAGERPFGDPQTPAAMLTAMLSQTPMPITNFADVPGELEALVMRCLDREPAARFADVIELGDELDRMLSLDDSTKTQVSRAPSLLRATTDELVPEDSLTWVDAPPSPPMAPIAPMPAANPVTTLPGVMPPSPGTPWPLDDPKKRPKG
jgi:serine/threonine-protein kinase